MRTRDRKNSRWNNEGVRRTRSYRDGERREGALTGDKVIPPFI